MRTVDLSEENFIIKNVISVIKGKNTKHHKSLSVNGRPSDAFVCVLSGSCEYRFDDGTEFTAREGDVFYLPCHSVYTMYITSESYDFIFCDFEFREKNASAALYPRENVSNINSLFVKLLNVFKTAKRGSNAECMSIIYSILSTLQKLNERTYLPKNSKRIVSDAARYMQETFNDGELTIPKVASRLGISEVYFRKLFKTEKGISPIKFLTSLRVNNAKKLMEYPFLSLEECAVQSGFASLQYFSRVFKNEFGTTPGKYRQRLL